MGWQTNYPVKNDPPHFLNLWNTSKKTRGAIFFSPASGLVIIAEDVADGVWTTSGDVMPWSRSGVSKKDPPDMDIIPSSLMELLAFLLLLGTVRLEALPAPAPGIPPPPTEAEEAGASVWANCRMASVRRFLRRPWEPGTGRREIILRSARN